MTILAYNILYIVKKKLTFRLTGVYAFVILFHMTLLRVFTGGPGDLLPTTIQSCRLSWWRHLLYVTNYDFKSDYFDSSITVSEMFY